MDWSNKYYLFLLVCSLINLNSAISDEVFLDEDKPYQVLDIKVPKDVWELAMNPTPLLKSPVTIVVPIHVPQDDEETVDDSENEIVTEETVLADSTTTQEIVQDVAITEAPVVADVITEKPQNEISTTAPVATATQQVNGTLIRFPCTCQRGQCGCCTGAILQRWQTKVCGNITFVPEDFIFDVRLTVNDRTVIRRRVSASDPPPICFNPRRAPFVEVCAEISNIRIKNRNAFACLDINADIGGFPIYSASFRCFGLGASGVQTGLRPRPVSSGPAPVSLYGNSNNNNDDGDGFLGIGQIFGDDDDDDDGPFGAIGDAIGDIFEK